MSLRTTVEIVAPVKPVARMRPTRLMVPAARITSSTAARLLAWGIARAGAPTWNLRFTSPVATRRTCGDARGRLRHAGSLPPRPYRAAGATGRDPPLFDGERRSP
ncbi:hypothetical protein GCM10009834_17680 [Streptomonospora arabica]|uniref:Uncharacterized protein n=1 Tax=Streptomonospora halophila TaxID=427369 RepID=A0ABP9GTA5_9ACTN